MVNTYISFWTWVRASIHILIYTSQSNRTKIQALVEFREGFQSRLSPLCSQRLYRRGRWCSVEFPVLCASNLCLGRDFPENTMCRGISKEKVFHFLLWYSGEWGVSIYAEASATQPGEQGFFHYSHSFRVKNSNDEMVQDVPLLSSCLLCKVFWDLGSPRAPAKVKRLRIKKKGIQNQTILAQKEVHVISGCLRNPICNILSRK